MNTLLTSLFPTEQFTNDVDKSRALFLYAISSIGIVGVFLLVYLFPLEGNITIITRTQNEGFMSLWWAHLMVLIFASSYLGIRIEQIQASALTLTLGFFAVLAITNRNGGLVAPIDLLLLPTIILVSGMILAQNQFRLVSATVVFVYIFINTVTATAPDISASIPYAAGLIIFSVIVYLFQRLLGVSLTEGRDIESGERLKLAEVNMRITRQASARESLDTALNSTLNLILDNYPAIYHAQVFLLDSDSIQAKLVASTGNAGKRLMEQAHSLAVGGLSVIGQATFTGETVIARPGEKDSVHRVNEILPHTKLEVAFPLRVGDTVIGALDLQSKELEDLNENDRLTFQSLTNSLSLAIDSIQQFEQAKTRVNENQQLTEQTRTALREVERLNQRLIGRAWSEYTKGQGDNQGIEVNFIDNISEPYNAWTNTLAEAVDSKNLVQEGNIIAVPLRVRGQVVGAMEFELDENQEFAPEDLELIIEISERFGLAAENTRLVEESQRSAQRATMINQMTSRFQSAQNVEATLAEAARSLSDTLSADKVMIRLGVPENPANGKED